MQKKTKTASTYKYRAVKVFNKLLAKISITKFFDTSNDDHVVMKAITVFSLFLAAITVFYVGFNAIRMLIDTSYIAFSLFVSLIFVIYVLVLIDEEPCNIENIEDKKSKAQDEVVK